MNDLEIGWVAGIIEGEGTICSRPSSMGSNYVEVSMTDEDTIQKLLNTTGFGNVRGPYKRDNKKLFWIWHVADASSLSYLLDTIYPLMSIRRQEKIKECRDNLVRKLINQMPKPCKKCGELFTTIHGAFFCSKLCKNRFYNSKEYRFDRIRGEG